MKEYQTTAFLEPVGLAVILGEEGEDYRWSVGRAGMELIMDYERGRAGGDPEKLAKIMDVSHVFKGCDEVV